MQEMQRELEELEAQNRQLAIQGYSDQSETSGMSMEDLLTYTEKYTVESEELEQQIIRNLKTERAKLQKTRAR